ncbi:hypothetical protein BSKO_08557 [Bryopsis sp. KO-2023]|nr:hypothetical protein BSKO_08557 [Bryopsis sp. KO-2023]
MGGKKTSLEQTKQNKERLGYMQGVFLAECMFFFVERFVAFSRDPNGKKQERKKERERKRKKEDSQQGLSFFFFFSFSIGERHYGSSDLEGACAG